MEFWNQTLLTIGGYPLSLLELVGVLTGLIAVWMASRAKAANFLFGLVNAVAYFLLYFQFRLYSVMLLQVVYFVFNFYGYYHWKHARPEDEDSSNERKITVLNLRHKLFIVVGFILAGFVWGSLVIKLQASYPEHFDPPAYPMLDAIITMGSLAAQFLLSKKIWDNWWIWIVLDAISTVLYFSLGMVFTAVFFAVLTLIAIKALFEWKKKYEAYKR